MWPQIPLQTHGEATAVLLPLTARPQSCTQRTCMGDLAVETHVPTRMPQPAEVRPHPSQRRRAWSVAWPSAGAVCSVPEEVLLDENVEARKHEYYDVHDVSVTDDGRVIAFSEDCVGNELYSVRIMDAVTRRPLLAEGPVKTTGQVEWAADNSTFFYVAQDQKQRPYQVRRRSGPDVAPRKGSRHDRCSELVVKSP